MKLKPMLATDRPVETMVDLAADDRWAFQVKYNGHRVLLQVVDGVVTVLGRDGQTYQHNATFGRGRWAAAFAALPDCVLDGELLGVNEHRPWQVWLFDVVLLESDWASITPTETFSRRAEVLADLYARWSPPGDLFGLAPTANDHAGKLHLALACMRSGGEGVIARRLDATYSMQRSLGVIKLKFIHDADLVVDSTGFEGRNNVVLVAYDEAGGPIEVGRASANGKGTFARGDVVTVRYNYMSAATAEFPNGRLVGPRIVVRRTDKAPAECTTDQLHYSPEVPVDEH